MEEHQAYGHSGPACAFQQETYHQPEQSSSGQPSNPNPNVNPNPNQQAAMMAYQHQQQQQQFAFSQHHQQQQMNHQQFHPQPLPPIHFASQPQPAPPNVNLTYHPHPQIQLHPTQFHPNQFNIQQQQPQPMMINYNQHQHQMQHAPSSNPSLPPSIHHSPQPSAGATVRLQNFVFPPNSINDNQTGSMGTMQSAMSNVNLQNQTTSASGNGNGAILSSSPSGKGNGNWKQKNNNYNQTTNSNPNSRASSILTGVGGGETTSSSSNSNSTQPTYSYPVSKNGTPLLGTPGHSHYSPNNRGINQNNRNQKTQSNNPASNSNIGNVNVELQNPTNTTTLPANPIHPILTRLPSLPDLPSEIVPPKGLDLESLQRTTSTSLKETDPDSGSHLSENQPSYNQSELLDFIQHLSTKVQILEKRDDIRNLREEALAFRPELVYEDVSDAKGKGKGMSSIGKEKDQQFHPVLGVRLLQRIDTLQKENEELGSILSEKLGLNLDLERRKFKEGEAEIGKEEEKEDDEKGVLKKELEGESLSDLKPFCCV